MCGSRGAESVIRGQDDFGQTPFGEDVDLLQNSVDSNLKFRLKKFQTGNVRFLLGGIGDWEELLIEC